MTRTDTRDLKGGGIRSSYGKLTEENIQRLRDKIGIQFNQPRVMHNMEVSWDGSRHFAHGYGDANPLWCDRDYGKKTRWGELITAPGFIYSIGIPDANPTLEEKATLKGDPFAGIGSYQAALEFEWWNPLKLGDQVFKRACTVGVKENPQSEFGGRSVSEINAFFFRNQKNELIALQRGTWIRAEREASKKRKKAYQLPEPYSEEQLEKISVAYAMETVRGADTLYWEDVEEGHDLPKIVRGPLRITDLFLWHMGTGMQISPPGAFGISHAVLRKTPGLFTPNKLNIPDTVQRLHWDVEWANEVGVPTTYDYGSIRECLLMNLITNWMGDDGWLWKLKCQHRKFVYTGDTYWVTGKVTAKRITDVGAEVDLEVWIENQRGTVVSPGSATVLLPTRDMRVNLPNPPAETIDGLVQILIQTSNDDQ